MHCACTGNVKCELDSPTGTLNRWCFSGAPTHAQYFLFLAGRGLTSSLSQGLHTIPSGWAEPPEDWLPGIVASGPRTPPIEVMVRTPSRAASYAVYPFYTNGIGGICNDVPFTPNVSFWCNPNNPRDGARGVWNASGGLVYNQSIEWPKEAQGNWNSPEEGVVHVWHSGGHWATMMFSNLSHAPEKQTISWTSGGYQDARASNTGAGELKK